MMDIESNSFSWDRLSSLHHTEHGCSTEHSEDEMNKAFEVHHPLSNKAEECEISCLELIVSSIVCI